MINPAAKEVQNYAFSLKQGFHTISKQDVIRLNDILEVQQHIEKNRAGLRKVSGTDLSNAQTGEQTYTPPQEPIKLNA